MRILYFIIYLVVNGLYSYRLLEHFLTPNTNETILAIAGVFSISMILLWFRNHFTNITFLVINGLFVVYISYITIPLAYRMLIVFLYAVILMAGGILLIRKNKKSDKLIISFICSVIIFIGILTEFKFMIKITPDNSAYGNLLYALSCYVVFIFKSYDYKKKKKTKKKELK